MEFFSKIAFRSPLRSIDALSSIDFLNDHSIKEALYLASPVLLSEAQKNNTSLKEQKKLANSLYKYKARLTSRCTPYGLFAGIGIAEWGTKNEIELNGQYRRNTRLDMNVLCSIVDHISKKEEYFHFFTFFPNKTYYIIANQVRYIEYYYEKGFRVYQISSIENNEYLQKIFALSKNGATIQELASGICDEEIDNDEALNYVYELIKAQVLINNIEPTVTGEEFHGRLIKQLRDLNLKAKSDEIDEVINTLDETIVDLGSLDSKVGNETSAYENIFRRLKNLNIPFNEKDVFQTDLAHIPNKAEISHEIQNKVTATIRSLAKLFPNNSMPNLEAFKTNFINRYERKKVPLLQLLDKEIGLGFLSQDRNGINPLIEDLFISTQKDENRLNWTSTEEFLFKKLTKARSEGENCVYISSKEIDELNKENISRFPDTIYAMINIVDPEENKLYFQYAGGASAASIAGRFGFVSEEISALLNEIDSYEASVNKNKILAEIVHLPESRTGNILFRPDFRTYEIPFLAQSSLPSDNQILPGDLSVCVRNDRLVLWSDRHNAEILPKLGNAHNFTFNAQPIYQFLCELQLQGKTQNTSFKWGSLAYLFNYLPRVEIDGVIVFAATWQLKKNDFATLLNVDLNEDAVKAFTQKFKLPNKVLLVEGDNELLINFEMKESILALVDLIKDKDFITLKEFLLKDKFLVKDLQKENYTNECVLFIKPNSVSASDEERQVIYPEVNIQRDFPPGSPWVYYKLYSGIKTLDRILADELLPVINLLMEEKLCQKWFFIRYFDPEAHIRLRFYVPDQGNIPLIMNKLHNAFEELLKQSSIEKYVLDTYTREVERYFYTNIENMESLFFLDSVCISSLLSQLEGQEGHNLRWKWAFGNVDAILNDFKYSDTAKHEFLKKMKLNFAKEFGLNKNTKVQLDQKFRHLRKEIVMAIENRFENTDFSVLYEPIAERSASSRDFVNKVFEIVDAQNIDLIVSSYIHMSLNRLFMGNQRLNEFVIYDMLFRYYDSKLAQQRKKPVTL
ncbi:MAG TPA: lantibiotic dehydratase [Bacteroidia bacterium]|nr:lantibiotic dehydratase [Bacteroidia bacterium]